MNQLINPLRILIPTDLTEASTHAYAYAHLLAEGSEAEVVLLLHVMPLPPAPIFSRGGFARRYSCCRHEIERIASERFPGCHTRTIMTVGSIPEAIVRKAEEEQADLIVLCERQRRWGRLWWSASITERVARTAPCPVLTVRSPDKAPEARTLSIVPDVTRGWAGIA